MSKKYTYVSIICLIVLLFIGGITYYINETKRIRSEIYLDLQTISDFKIEQILQWRKERIADANHFSTSSLYVKAVEEWLHSRDSVLGNEIIHRNMMIRDLRGFESVFIATSDKTLHLLFDTLHHKTDTVLSMYIDSVFLNPKVYFSDFYANKNDKHIHSILISPIINSRNHVIAAILFLVDPNVYFYPVVEKFPISGKTYETIILRQDSDSLLFVSNSRYFPNSALRLRIPIKKNQLARFNDLSDTSQFYEGEDYRNVEVLANFRYINGTNWFIITKVDKHEIFSELQYRAISIFIFTIILLFLSIAVLGMFIMNKARNKERKSRIEIELSEARLNRAEYISKTGNWEVHIKTGMVLGSLGAQKIYGLNGKQWNISQVQSVALPAYRALLANALKALIEHNEPYEIDFKIQNAETNQMLDIHSIATLDKYNKIIFGTIQDISDRKKIEQELMMALVKAEKSDKLKEAFLQNMSHEIRTPLNAITGFADLLNNTDITTDKRNQFISIIINSSNQLLSIVNDILTVSRIQTGQEITNFSSVDLQEVVNDLYTIFKSKARQQGLELILTIEDNNFNKIIKTDSTKLIQIVTNLLTNALKFTHSGTIEFGYRSNNKFIEFFVKDTGIGIKKEQQEFIFERFAQADLSIGKKYGGTGLGLSICKAFTELLGGSIKVDSEIGAGSCFSFTIPYNPVPTQTPPDILVSKNSMQDTKTILIADDERVNCQLIQEILINSKFNLLFAGNGKEAIEICRQTTQIDLVLMDIKMPEMDGLSAMKEIKKIRPHLLVIAQTAYAFVDEKDRYLNLGFDDYIIKPIKKDELITKILHLLVI